MTAFVLQRHIVFSPITKVVLSSWSLWGHNMRWTIIIFFCQTLMAHGSDQYTSLNYPEENDETRSEDFESDRSSTVPQPAQIILQHNTGRYAHQTPFPSWDGPVRPGSPHSLPSCLPSAVYHTLSEEGSFFPSRPHSLPSPESLEYPRSLRSCPPSTDMYHHPSPSYPPCCGQFGPPPHPMIPVHHCSSGHQPLYRPSGALRSKGVVLNIPVMGYSYVSFESPQQKVKKHFHCLIICIYLYLTCSTTPKRFAQFFQTPPLRDANLLWLVDLI